jgi:hypothetical protein
VKKIPIFHLGLIRRTQGNIRSAVDAMAYVLGKQWNSAYDGNTYDHRAKAGEVVYSQVLTPPDTPEFACQPYVLAHAIEYAEKANNAQLLRHIYFSLPPELSRELHMAFMKEYAQTFVERGMIVLMAVHDGGTGNPNGHLLLTMRPLLPDGTFAPKSQREYIFDEHGQRRKGKNGKTLSKKILTTDWNYPSNGELWRKTWGETTNKYYTLAGLDIAIDYRSLKRQGIQRIPTVYLSPADHRAERRGERTDIGDLNRYIHYENERRETEKQRQEAINQLFEAFKEKYDALGKRKQYRSPHTRATQHFWSDLHDIEDQFKTGTSPASQTAENTVRANCKETHSMKDKGKE